MSKNESFTSINELKKHFPLANSDNGGPIIFWDKGKAYCHPGEAHTAIIGNTGCGKTQGVILPLVKHCIDANESILVADPKGEIYRKTINAIPDYYKIIIVNFRDPIHSPDKWNALKSIYQYLHSDDISLRDIGSSNVYELARSLCPNSEHADPFWTDSATELISGLIYALIELSDNENKTHIGSVLKMLRDGNERSGANIVLKDLYNLLPDDSLARINMSTYINAPNDTRNSIYSVASNGLSIFARSHGLLNMIAQDTIDIANLDNSERPIAIYIILPDETSNYDQLCGSLVQQLTQHFVLLAQNKPNQRLGNRMNIILEELGSIGSALGNLPNLMVASRSRNIRLTLCLQSLNQLDDIYKKAAETIKSCIGLTYAFTSNNFDTLEEWSKRCGEHDVMRNGNLVKEPLITASQLAAMPPLTCLLLINNRWKFIHKFPLFHEVFDTVPIEEVEIDRSSDNYIIQYYDIKEHINAEKNKKRDELFGKSSPTVNPFLANAHLAENSEEDDELDLDIDKALARIRKQMDQISQGDNNDE